MSLVVFAPNWLGDAVMALPALADIRRHHLDLRCVVAARPGLTDLFELTPGVDAVIGLSGPSDGGGWRRFGLDVERVRAASARRAVLLPNSARSALVAWRAGVPERCGYRRDFRGGLLTHAIERPRGRVHQVDYYRHLAERLGAEPGAREPAIELPAALLGESDELLGRHGRDPAAPLLGVAPGAAFGGAKRWPADRFARVLATLSREAGVSSVLLGADADREVACAVAREAGKMTAGAGAPPVIDLTGSTSLRQLMGIVARCSAFLSNDSGAMHLAAALGVPVVAVFGPTDDRATAPVPRPAPIGRRPVTTIVGRAWCRPCGLRECPIDHRCMTRIDVDQVATSVKDLL